MDEKTPISEDLLAALTFFRDLEPGQRTRICALMRKRDITRGWPLVVEGEPSHAIFIVLHGAFEVVRSDISTPIAELQAGDMIGEIGFFAETARTATVTALRDAAVLELDRAALEQIAREAPSIMRALLAALARRLDATSARLPVRRRRRIERTIAIVHGGYEPVPPEFMARLRRALIGAGARVIDRNAIEAQFGRRPLDGSDITHWLNGLEWEGKPLIYVADPDFSDWTRKCIRQADMVVMVTRGTAPSGSLTQTESFLCEVHAPATRRLVRIHDRRVGVVSGTGDWLRRIEVFIHHHVSLEDEIDIESLTRFLTGRAVGFIAGGGGAFGSAHVGIFKAFDECGVTFDAFIGTSVGAAMLAGFAKLLDAEHLDSGTHDIFVTSRSFKRPTWPRYGLLDHKNFDEALARAYGSTTLIEDCWRPFFAVATNLSTQRLELIRTGSLWKAVRASSAIPAVLPPFYTDDGMMLVDGGVMDNAPLAPLQDIKVGPNLIVHFGRTGAQRFNCRYDDLPGRWKLIAAELNPFGRRRLPRAPGALNVLVRSLLAHQRYELPLDPQDLVLRPPPFPGSGFLDFDEHTRVFHASYQWCKSRIAELSQENNIALAAILATARGSRQGGDGNAARSLPEAVADRDTIWRDVAPLATLTANPARPGATE